MLGRAGLAVLGVRRGVTTSKVPTLGKSSSTTELEEAFAMSEQDGSPKGSSCLPNGVFGEVIDEEHEEEHQQAGSEQTSLTSPVVSRLASGGGFGRMPRKLTVETKHRLISDVILDSSSLDESSCSAPSCASKKHPAQAVQTPGKVVSLWGAATKDADVFSPFFTQKAINFHGELSRLRHRLGILCHRGQKPESPNQDDFFVLARSESVLFGVMDGHGPDGHDVSHFAQEHLPTRVMEHIRKDCSWPEAVCAAFSDGHRSAAEDLGEKIVNSGCTVTMLMLTLPRAPSTAVPLVRCAWVGDSLAVAAKRPASGGSWITTLLVNAHRPDRADEAKRIATCGGIVKVGATPGEGARLHAPRWSIAMSRSFGDTEALRFGLGHDPEFSDDLLLEPGFEHFLLVCSDGIWDMIPPIMAVNMVGKFGPTEAQLAVERLVHKARMRWQQEGDVVDDITAILLWPAETAETPTADSGKSFSFAEAFA